MNDKDLVTPKNNLLIRSFVTVFPGCDVMCRPSQGIFTRFDRYVAKRTVCFSTSPVTLGNEFRSYFTEAYLFDTPAIWGLCGVHATRKNGAFETEFVLCRNTSEHFVACAIIYFSDDPASPTGLRIDSMDYLKDL